MTLLAATPDMFKKFIDGDSLTDMELKALLDYYTGLENGFGPHAIAPEHKLFAADIAKRVNTLRMMYTARTDKPLPKE